MKKNVKNKILAFSMASAMIVPNVAVVFAEAPKTGSAKTAEKASETKTVYVTYYYTDDKGVEQNAGMTSITVDASATTVSTELLKNGVPEGYEICVLGDEYIGESTGDSYLMIEVRPVKKKTINVTYYYTNAEGKKVPCGTDSVKLDASATTFNNTTLTNVPEGYEICVTGDEWIGNVEDGGFYEIEVHQKAVEKKTINVTYYYVDEKGENHSCGTDSVKIDASATTFNTSALKNVPEGYEICVIGDVYVGKLMDSANIEVRQKAVEKKTINVTYYYVDEKGENHSCGTDSVKIDASATTFNTSALKNVPEGYEICVIGDVYVGKLMDSANIEVRKKAAQTRTVYVHYIDAETKIPFENAIEKIEIPADEIHVNTKDLKEIPAGYEPVVTGDLDFYNRDNVNVELRKIEKVTTLHVNFETVDGTVVGEKTFEKTSTDEEDVVFALDDDIVLPEGYHWVDYNDQIKNVTLPAGATGGHVMFVEQDETKAVLTVTFETKDGETVGTTSIAKEFAVDENGDKVTTFVLGEDFTLPEGYHLADGVDQVTEITMAGTVGGHTVIVEKDAVAPTPTEDPKKDDAKKDDTKKEETKKPSKTADTADTSDVAAYAIPLVMSMVAISAIVVGRKKLS